jgi:hypothetical protein
MRIIWVLIAAGLTSISVFAMEEKSGFVNTFLPTMETKNEKEIAAKKPFKTKEFQKIKRRNSERKLHIGEELAQMQKNLESSNREKAL